jgi:hypothetical protein
MGEQFATFLSQFPDEEKAILDAIQKGYEEVFSKYRSDDNIHLLAFIHDEVVFEVRADLDWKGYVEEVSRLMIESMQKVLKGVRVAVEASVMTHWQKSGGEYEVGYFMNPGEKELRKV